MSAPGPAIRRSRKPLTAEETRRKNRVERIKHEKAPLALREELDRLAGTPYEDVDEDDVLRLQWLGLYHDKPKTGEFMLRVKLPGGVVTPAQLEAIGELSLRWGQGTAELTTRQDVQVHRVALAELPQVFAHLAAAGLSSVGACGDVLRNITSCPVAGVDPAAAFDTGPVLRALAERFDGAPTADLPRKHKWTLSACPSRCNAPEIHDIGLVGALREGAPGFGVLVGGGLSTTPRIGRDLGVFITPDVLAPLLEALMGVWNDDLRYRRSRGRSRFKFVVEDLGVEGLRRAVETRLGHALDSWTGLGDAAPPTSHLGVNAARQPGRVWIGTPVPAGLTSGEQLVALGRAAAARGMGLRLTREQNLVIVDVPEADAEGVVSELIGLGLDPGAHPLHGQSIACTGNPFCNFAVGDTKPRLRALVEHLTTRWPEVSRGLRLYLDGCPHACGQHWVGDIGIQGTTRRTEEGRVMAYDILLRGGLGPGAAIGKAILRKVPSPELEDHIDRLLTAFEASDVADGGLAAFVASRDDEQLTALLKGGE